MSPIVVQGQPVPAVGFGTWALIGDEAIEGTRHALELGYRQMLIHWPSDEVPLADTLGAMVAAQAAGLVRHLGVSNFRAPLLGQAMDLAPIFADQVLFRPGRTQQNLLALAAEHDILITAYSPLRGPGVQSPILAEIAAAHGRSPQQVALRWLLQHDRVSPIPRSSNPEHRAQNLAVFDFELTGDEMARISALRTTE